MSAENATPNPIELLLVLQTHDTQIRAMEKEMRDIPARKQQEATRLDEYRKRVEAAQKQLKTRESELKQLELEARSRQEKIVKLRQQQLELKMNKEFKAVETEVEAILVEISRFEDQQLELMDVMERDRKALDAESRTLKEQESLVAADIAVYDRRMADLTEELNRLKAIRAEAAQPIPQSFLLPYERVLAHKDVALVPLENGICGGCHMKLPPSVLHDTRKRLQLVSCGYCGRMLY